MWWVVNVTPRPFYHQETPRNHCTGGWVGHWAGLDGCGKPRSHRDSILGPQFVCVCVCIYIYKYIFFFTFCREYKFTFRKFDPPNEKNFCFVPIQLFHPSSSISLASSPPPHLASTATVVILHFSIKVCRIRLRQAQGC